MTYGFVPFGDAGSKVVGGTPDFDPDIVQLTDRQRASIGAFVIGGRPVCTGTVVAPRVVLSAAHCSPSVGRGASFVVGDDAGAPTASATVLEARRHPSWVPGVGHPDDYLLCYLDSDLPVDPIAIGVTPAANDIVQTVGYGRTDPDLTTNTRRWWLTEQVREVASGTFQVYGVGRHGLCNGDSGGPALAMQDGLPAVIGTVSYGEGDCTGTDVFNRADVARSWASATIAEWQAHPPSPILITATMGWIGDILLAGILVGFLVRRKGS